MTVLGCDNTQPCDRTLLVFKVLSQRFLFRTVNYSIQTLLKNGVADASKWEEQAGLGGD